ncbi:hypothetical protein [Muricomes intestini]|jgi:hypothetical protein|uniref:Uncharacterized protein n=1 Tax=Muricomes intestini TaxID=1796634 RepID=A0A4R3K0T4_9FIRM|nr:hypothetical protein [Muricomes intestini]TCS74545.1 hypothetical protein EDD59_13719 [Muricomes intestini]HAX50345.1 hypothetical protein [Lachnospiraceae bacterium]HCR82012.1 hypothetical protein [Lachnospiraceae bacterium]
MRNAVIVFFMIIILIFSGATIQTAENRTMRKNELESSLGAAMKQSMKILKIHSTYDPGTSPEADELAADFIQGFLMKITSNSDFTIEILGMDVEKGLLDVRVTEKYKQIIGYGKISCRKTVILENVETREEKFYLVSFWIPKEEKPGGEVLSDEYIIKKVNVRSGDILDATLLPKNSILREGYTFCGWKLVKPVSGLGGLYGEENISSFRVEEDMEFQAVYQ